MSPLARVTTAMAALPEKLNGWLGTLPSTNARIVVTLVCVFGTAIRFWWKGAPANGWEAWLTFLAAMSGVDTLQFLAKRKTQHPPAKAGDPS
jgi:hypothetical protein